MNELNNKKDEMTQMEFYRHTYCVLNAMTVYRESTLMRISKMIRLIKVHNYFLQQCECPELRNDTQIPFIESLINSIEFHVDIANI